MNPERPVHEKPVPLVRGTSAQMAAEHRQRQRLASAMLEPMHQAGYDWIRTPDLDLVELHERKSGAAITTRIVEMLSTGNQGPVCLRPELTVGVVRSMIESEQLSDGPVRVSLLGSVYRMNGKRGGDLSQIDQIGAELLGDPTVDADAEVIALAIDSLTKAGVDSPTLRLGDVGLILEAVSSAGLPPEVRKAIVEALADAAASGQDLTHVETALEHWGDWLGDQAIANRKTRSADEVTGPDLKRLFHQLVPQVVGRRTETEILDRMRQKWVLAEKLPEALIMAARLVHELGNLSGEPARVFEELASHPIGSLAENGCQRLRELVRLLTTRHGIEASRIRIDLGVARGLGFYTGLVFSLHAGKADGLELAGGGRYDGLASVLGMSDGADFGVGFAIGLDRVIRSFPSVLSDDESPVTYVLQTQDDSDESIAVAMDMIRTVRQNGGRCRLATSADSDRATGSVLVDVSFDGRVTCAETALLNDFLTLLMARS